jgi:hypothetical protein
MTKDQIVDRTGKEGVIAESEDQLGGTMLRLRTAPRPHESFKEYVLIISQAEDLLKIVAVSRNVDTASDGSELRHEYESLKQQLVKTYGDPTDDLDYLKRGSIWGERGDFMMGMLKHDRKLVCFWGGDNATLVNSISGISLMADAIDSSTGTVMLSYEFKGFDAYSERLKAKEGSVL